MSFLPRKSFVLILMLLMPMSSQSTMPDDLAELEASCFNKEFLYAVPACERIIEITEADHKVHFRLAKLYQKQRQFEKAKITLERALALFDEQGNTRRVNEAKHLKSNVDEEIWLSSQEKLETESSELKIKCQRFAKILPEQALAACDRYLAIHPDDQEVIQAQALATATIAKKAELEPVRVAQSRTLHNAANTVANRASVAAESEANVKSQPVQSQNVTASQSALEQETVDPKVIEQIKAELNGLYAMLRAQQAEESATPNQSLTYQEKGQRYALVVGNANYPKSIGRLKNSVNDAVDISKVLKTLGFEVSLVTDGSLEEIEKAVSDLSRRVQEHDTVLFYYAGHGVALEGENYLLPVSSGISDAIDVKYKSLNLSYVLDRLDRGSSGVTMVVLDACRNNPFPVSRGAMRAGLVQSSGPVGTIIAYSTAPGDVALDGDGRNGLYTKHLLRQITQPNVKLEDVFKRVRVAVSDETRGSQVPWENSSLKGDFYFSYKPQ